jgi:hypothetical protein
MKSLLITLGVGWLILKGSDGSAETALLFVGLIGGFISICRVIDGFDTGYQEYYRHWYSVFDRR